MSEILSNRFLAMSLPEQIDSINRSKFHDITRLVKFIMHCKTIPNFKESLLKLDTEHKETFDKLLQIYNLTQEQNFSFDTGEVKFSMEKKFEALDALLDVVIKGRSNGLLVCGQGGIGKTYQIELALKKARAHYHSIRGYSSNIELYNTIYAHRTELIFIDDCDSVFSDAIPLNILKAVLETSDVRKVSWLTPSQMLQAPATFEFTGKVIFATNLTVEKMSAQVGALLSRILYVNFNVTRDDIMRRIYYIAKTSPYRNLRKEERTRIASYIKSNMHLIRDLSLRSLVHGYDLYMHDKKNWRRNLKFMWVAKG